MSTDATDVTTTLADLEQVVACGPQAFVAADAALLEIRDRRIAARNDLRRLLPGPVGHRGERGDLVASGI